MSDGNRNPKGFRTEECRPPGRGVSPPTLCRREKSKKKGADKEPVWLQVRKEMMKRSVRLITRLQREETRAEKRAQPVLKSSFAQADSWTVAGEKDDFASIANSASVM